MVSLGSILLILGVVVLCVGYLARVPVAATLGWVGVGIGVLLVVLGYVVPVLDTPTYDHPHAAAPIA
jgi:hypothetical protein